MASWREGQKEDMGQRRQNRLKEKNARGANKGMHGHYWAYLAQEFPGVPGVPAWRLACWAAEREKRWSSEKRVCGRFWHVRLWFCHDGVRFSDRVFLLLYDMYDKYDILRWQVDKWEWFRATGTIRIHYSTVVRYCRYNDYRTQHGVIGVGRETLTSWDRQGWSK